MEEIKKIRDARIKGLKLYFVDNGMLDSYIRCMLDVVFLPPTTDGKYVLEWHKNEICAIQNYGLTPLLLRIEQNNKSDDVNILLGCFDTEIFFKDAFQDQTLPDKFYRIRSFVGFDDLKKYCFANNFLKFSLDTGDFKKTGKIEQGQSYI
ncbi:MAG: hypothetical protein IKQ31_05915 [Clostridia bacterium]|nr:hypothetical protein [Clostridia bacterium]